MTWLDLTLELYSQVELFVSIKLIGDGSECWDIFASGTIGMRRPTLITPLVVYCLLYNDWLLKNCYMRHLLSFVKWTIFKLWFTFVKFGSYLLLTIVESEHGREVGAFLYYSISSDNVSREGSVLYFFCNLISSLVFVKLVSFILLFVLALLSREVYVGPCLINVLFFTVLGVRAGSPGIILKGSLLIIMDIVFLFE